MNKTISQKLAQRIQDKCIEKCVEMPGSQFKWYVCGEKNKVMDNLDVELLCKIKKTDFSLYPAYDIPELLEWLPNHVEKEGGTYFLEMSKSHPHLYTAYYEDKEGVGLKFSSERDLPEALGEMLLYLLDNDLLK